MKKLKQTVASILLFAMVVAITGSTKAYALSDGAYTVSVSYSYKNPETGKTVDGSTNIALGESMIGSMLETTALVEQVNGKTYVTIGLGLMSNVSNVRIMTQSSSGSYKQASITKTGSGTKNGDTVNHYRFQVSSTDKYISPILFIDPMGRDVQFFVKLKMSTKKSGSGIYNALMVSSEETKATATPKATKKPASTPKATATAKPTEAPKATAKATEAAKTPEATKTPEVTVTKEPVATSEPAKAPEAAEEAVMTEAPQAPIEESAQEGQADSVQVTEEVQTKKDYTRPICIGIIVISVIGTAGLLYSNYRFERRDDKKGKNDE